MWKNLFGKENKWIFSCISAVRCVSVFVRIVFWLWLSAWSWKERLINIHTQANTQWISQTSKLMTAIGSRRRRRRILLNPHSICKFTFVFLLFIIISVIRYTPNFYLLLFAFEFASVCSFVRVLCVCVVWLFHFIDCGFLFFSVGQRTWFCAPHIHIYIHIHCINKRLLKSAGNGKIVENWLLEEHMTHDLEIGHYFESNLCVRCAQTHTHAPDFHCHTGH